MNKHTQPLVIAGAAIACAGLAAFCLHQGSSPNEHRAVGSSRDRAPSTASTPGSTPGPPTVLQAIMARDISICDHRPPTPPARSKLCRDEYYFFLSLKENVDHCDGIQQKMLGDACRMLVAGENRCSQLVAEKTIDGLNKPNDIQLVCESCFGNLKACDAVKDEHDRGLCTSMHYLVKAARTKDPSVCDRIVNEDDNEFLCRYLAKP